MYHWYASALDIQQNKMHYFSSPPNKWLKTTLDYQLIRKVCFSSRCWLGDLTEVEEFKMESPLSGASTAMAGAAGLARDFPLPPCTLQQRSWASLYSGLGFREDES